MAMEKQDAVIRRIEILGEAAKQVSNSITTLHNQVPWKEMAGMRDVLIHQYFGVNPNLVWRVATVDVPYLRTQIQAIIDTV